MKWFLLTVICRRNGTLRCRQMYDSKLDAERASENWRDELYNGNKVWDRQIVEIEFSPPQLDGM